MHRSLIYDRESQSLAVFTKMFRNYLTTRERAKCEQCDYIFFVERLISELLKNLKSDNIFNAIHDRSSLQEA